MFEHARELLERYYCRLLAAQPSPRAEHLLHELRGRLRALDWMYSQMLRIEADLEASVRAQAPAGSTEPAVLKMVFTDTGRPDCTGLHHAKLPPGPSDELRVVLEAFYYSAHRVRDILRDSKDHLPGLSSFEAVGVRDVRNHLVEHPTRKNGVVVFSFACGGPVGPQLKPMRWSGDDPGTADAGLHANIREFADALERTLGSGIQGLVTSGRS